MYKNNASIGANMFLSVCMTVYRSITVHINNCRFFGGKSTSKGGGFMVQIDWYKELSNVYAGSLRVYLANSELYGNSATNGSGLYLGVKDKSIPAREENFLHLDIVFIIQQCVCHDNVGKYGSGMYASSALAVKYFRISIHNMIFAGNVASLAGGAMYVNLLFQWLTVPLHLPDDGVLFHYEPIIAHCVIAFLIAHLAKIQHQQQCTSVLRLVILNGIKLHLCPPILTETFGQQILAKETVLHYT